MKFFLPFPTFFLFSSWKERGVRACMLLAWSLSLRSISQSSLSTSFNLAMSDVLEQDEVVIETALVDKVFFFLKVRSLFKMAFRSESFLLDFLAKNLTATYFT